MSWSAAQYVRFEAERNRPIRDLLGVVATDPVRTAADLGCGPGNSTALLLRHFPNAVVTAIDSSDDMIAAARRRLPSVRFEVRDIADWNDPGPFDLILANASLHWVPDHARLLPALIDKLAPDGSLAIQMPDNLDEPTHVAMREIARDERWRDALAPALAARAERHDAAWYYGLLCRTAATVDVWRTYYHHPLPEGADGIVEWFKGSGLRPFLDRIDEDERAVFLARYRAAVAHHYPTQADGTVLLGFPRLFIVATR